MNPEESLEPQSHSGSGCVNCGSSYVEPGHLTPLCPDCRRSFIRYPIPNWIKAFGGGVALVLIFALVNLPSQLSLGVHLARGKDAVDRHRFVTAQKELNAFTAKVPESEEALAHLLIASYYNQDFETFGKTLNKLEGRKVEDNALYQRAQDIINQATHYYPDTASAAMFEKYKDIPAIPDTAFTHFIADHHEDVWMRGAYAGKLFTDHNYIAADSLLRGVLKDDPEYKPALTIMATMKRMQDSTDQSIKYCNRMLSLNREDAEAMCMKARTLLKQKKDREAMDMINEALKQDKNNGYAKATLALAYHFSNQSLQRDKLMKEMQKDSVAATYLEYVNDVLTGKEKF